MRRALAQVMEVAGFASVAAGVYLVLGLGACLIAGGAMLVVAAVGADK